MSCNGTKRTKISSGTLRRRKTSLVRGLGLAALLAIAASAAAQSAPGRLAGVTASADDGSVTLSWTDPTDANIRRYEVRYAAAGASFGDWQQHHGERTALTVISLVNFLEYTFQVRAVNDAGPSPFAQISATPFFIDVDFIPSFEGRSVEPICYRVGTPVKQRLPGAFAAQTYSLSPALPAGLSFDPTGRLITGTPTAVQPATPYTLTASDAEGDQDAIEFTIKVEPDAMPSFGDATVSSQTYRVGSTIADLALPAATGGDGAIAYTLTPALPNGLTFDADARVVAGTPAERSAATEYVYAATDEDGDTATLTFEIEVEPDSMPDFGGSSIEAQTYRAGSTIADLALPAANGGDGAIAYALTPALPSGLTFDADARVVAGTPAERSVPTEYVYAATDEDGDTATLTFEIEVEPDSMPDFGGSSIEAQTYRAGSTIADLALPAANGGDGAIAYALTPALPSGLTFDADARVVAGTPAERSVPTEYVYAATDEDGDTATLTFEIEVEPDSMPDFGGSSIEAQTYRAGSTIADLALPAANGGDGAIAYALTPALPNGLTFDADARVVAGTPAEAAARTQYTYAATDEDGDTATLTFEIEVEPDSMPDFGGSSIEAQTYRAGSTIADLRLPAANGGDGAVAYALTPALPSGLTFDADARVVAGTPAEAAARTQYTYAATDEDGDVATLAFAIEVEPDLMPTFGDAAVPAQQYRVSTAIIDLVLPAASGGDGTLNYALTPALPSGLTFDVDALTIAGTPTAQMGNTDYALTATDEDGDTATLTFAVEVGMAITVAIADAAAPEGQELSFVVTLSDAVAVPVTVAYATADGTARAGEDYAAIAGTLTFPAGSTEMAIGVAVVADPRPERDEQFTVALSDLRNAEFADAQAIGTIADDDTERVRGEAMGHSLAVFGRALAADAVDAISGRFQEGPPTTTPLTFSSSTFGADESEALAAATALRFFDTDSEFGHMPGESKFLGRSSPLDSTVAGAFAGNANTAFALPFGANAADRGKWTLWGRGSTNRVSSQPDAMRVEGNVDTGYLGVDARLPRNTLVGLAVARSSADFEYRQTGVTEGDVSLDMTTVLPYIHWTLCNGLDLWALAGSGQGEATLVDDLGRADTDIDMRLAAFGLRNKLTTWRDLVWSLKADAFVAALEADEVIDALAAADANVERLRVLLEGRREWQRSEQSLLGATIEFGARLDSGDADSGLGAEIGGALDYRNLPAGLGLEARGRYLLAHADSAFDDWGLSVALELDPGDQGTGASLRLAPAWGRPSSGVANLWRADRMLGTGLATRRLDSAQRLDMEVGYGFHAKRAGALRLYGVVSRNDFGAPSYRLGGRTAAGKGVGWSLEVDRLRRFGGDADYGILLGIGNGMGIAAPPIR